MFWIYWSSPNHTVFFPDYTCVVNLVFYFKHFNDPSVFDRVPLWYDSPFTFCLVCLIISVILSSDLRIICPVHSHLHTEKLLHLRTFSVLSSSFNYIFELGSISGLTNKIHGIHFKFKMHEVKFNESGEYSNCCALKTNLRFFIASLST